MRWNSSTPFSVWYTSAMIREPTVIVFGAGASSDYNYPLGDRLLRTIQKKLDPRNDEWISQLRLYGINPTEIEIFRDSLLRSQQYSIDSFLERRPKFMKVGKLVIALSLIPHEDDYTLFSPDTNHSGCYQYIANNMTSGTKSLDEFIDNKLTIITFNYDRSFEYYLFNVVKNTYGNSYDECAAVLNRIPIIHVHGCLGKLPWQSSDAVTETRDYNPVVGTTEIQIAADQIAIISEIDGTSEEFKEAIKYLSVATRVYFLGFGYDETNLSRLKINEMPQGMGGMNETGFINHMRGSSMRLGLSKKAKVQSDWNIWLPSNDNVGSSCLEFLENYAFLS